LYCCCLVFLSTLSCKYRTRILISYFMGQETSSHFWPVSDFVCSLCTTLGNPEITGDLFHGCKRERQIICTTYASPFRPQVSRGLGFFHTHRKRIKIPASEKTGTRTDLWSGRYGGETYSLYLSLSLENIRGAEWRTVPVCPKLFKLMYGQ
jgi:hypothetical protein